MAYTSDKKPGALIAATVLANTDNVVVEQSGDVKKATLSQVEAKIFDAKTATSTPTGTEVVVVRQTDNNLRQVALSNIVPALNITNAQVSASAGIVDTKLATITTAGKVSNSATTATSANTINAIVARDGSGNFSAGTITATLAGSITGNAATATTATTATTLATGRNIILSNDVTGTSPGFNGSANVTIQTTIANNAITTSKIADANVTTVKIADSNITTAKIADSNITTAKIADSNITTAKIANGAVTNEKIQLGTILNDRINASANIAGSKISPNFGSQAVTTTGNINGSKFIPTGTSAVGNGMYLPASDTLAFSTNGTERLRINSSGWVGIGINNPPSQLSVYQSAADVRIVVEGTTTTPANPGHFIGLDLRQDGVFSGGLFRNLSSNNRLSFFSKNAGESLTLLDGGNVGIGTTSPSSRLHVSGDITLSNTTTSNTATGGGLTLPANPTYFLVVSVNSVICKIPLYT